MLRTFTSSLTAPSAPSLQEGGTLLSLCPGECGCITRIDRPELEMALLKMGVAVGDQVCFVGVAPLRDPVSIRVHRTKLLLRREDASHIWISRG